MRTLPNRRPAFERWLADVELELQHDQEPRALGDLLKELAAHLEESAGERSDENDARAVAAMGDPAAVVGGFRARRRVFRRERLFGGPFFASLAAGGFGLGAVSAWVVLTPFTDFLSQWGLLFGVLTGLFGGALAGRGAARFPGGRILAATFALAFPAFLFCLAAMRPEPRSTVLTPRWVLGDIARFEQRDRRQDRTRVAEFESHRPTDGTMPVRSAPGAPIRYVPADATAEQRWTQEAQAIQGIRRESVVRRQRALAYRRAAVAPVDGRFWEALAFFLGLPLAITTAATLAGAGVGRATSRGGTRGRT